FDVAGVRFTWKVRARTPAMRFQFTNSSLSRGKVCRAMVTPIAKSFMLPGHIDFLQVTGAQEEWIPSASAETIIIPTNALHAIYNRTDKSARLLSISTQLHQAFF